ncbi:phage tail tube protein [Clostridium sp. YIM B02500]|uniref:phage tail tube protein n=1 Tax=Clostridium sp. YIM B02500 TaxID=2910681 RepID=UPI001EEF5E10|nr:phage tail tube protein [Clostridium sp. YIM B02500]
MANQAIANKILTGSSGNLWFNGQLLATLSKIEAKVKGDFEDVSFCGDNATYSRYNGWSGEGTLTVKKVDSTIWKICADAYKSGVMPDIKLISSLTDAATGKSEKTSIEGITITEFMLAGFESKKMIEEEFPFKFGDFDPIETI